MLFMSWIVYVPVSVERLAHLLWNTVLFVEVLKSIRKSGMTSAPFIVHVGLGVGMPVKGTVIVKSSPAITVISRMLRSLVILGAPENVHIIVLKNVTMLKIKEKSLKEAVFFQVKLGLRGD